MEKINKSIIGMCHLLPLPGEPAFNFELGIDEISIRAIKEVKLMQKLDMSAILISNEFGFPYIDKVDMLTQLAMSNIVGRIKETIKIPFGIDCMYDSLATINIALATEADFIRITLGKSDSLDYLYGNTNIGLLVRKLNNYKTRVIPKIFLNASLPIKSMSSLERADFIACILTQISPFALCLSSNEINDLNNDELLNYKKNSLLICDGGCNKNNILQIIEKTDGIIIGTSLKKNRKIENMIDYKNTKEIMELINH